MPTLKEIMEHVDSKSLSQPTYSYKEVKSLLGRVAAPKQTAMSCKSGDIFTTYDTHKKSRPHLIISVKEDKVIFVTLTTTKDHNVLCEFKGRFFIQDEVYIGSTISIGTVDYARVNMVSVYDNPVHIKEIKEKLKKLYTL